MNKTKVFAVYDTQVGNYAQPFFLRSKGEALRGWQEVANDKTNNIGKYPQDYTLFLIAEFDDQTGKFENKLTPESLGVASEYVKAEKTYEEAFERIKNQEVKNPEHHQESKH